MADMPHTVETLQQHLEDSVNQESQLFLVVRREVSLQRLITMWQRAARQQDLCSRLTVKYVGEEGIDQGALAKEFMSYCIEKIGQEVFKDGVPFYSMTYVSNKTYQTSGEIVSVCLANGGPPPQFMDNATFKCLFRPCEIVDVNDEDLAVAEKQMLDAILGDLENRGDEIMDHGYTGVVNETNAKQIANTMRSSYATRRNVVMAEFAKGLRQFGLLEAVARNKEVLQPLFVIPDLGKDKFHPTANYICSILMPSYSTLGTAMRTIEEAAVDFLIDIINEFEDKTIPPRQVAYVYKTESDAAQSTSTGAQEESAQEASEADSSEQETITVEATTARLLGWLTGSRHVPLNKKSVKIEVHFNHNCKRGPTDVHAVCYPVVSACEKSIKLPLKHMTTYEDFRTNFITGYFNGQAFGRP